MAITDNGTKNSLAADYLASATVTTWADLIALGTNLDDQGIADAWLADTAVSYVATVKIYVKAL